MLSAFTHSHRPEQRNLGDHDLAVIPADDTRAARQLDQNSGHATIVASRRRSWPALLGLPEPAAWGPFLSVTPDDDVRLDYAGPGIQFRGPHYALLVCDDVFDRALERIKAHDVMFWADRGMRCPNEINTNHGGRGVYFDDPSGHHFELITQPYGADL
jgi:hypothetical protein